MRREQVLPSLQALPARVASPVDSCLVEWADTDVNSGVAPEPRTASRARLGRHMRETREVRYFAIRGPPGLAFDCG